MSPRARTARGAVRCGAALALLLLAASPAAPQELATSASPVRIDQSGPGTSNGVVVNQAALPAGAATAANQARLSTFADAYNAAVAASGVAATGFHGLGGSTSFTKYNAFLVSSQPGTYFIQGSNDVGATQVTIATGALSANTPVTYSGPLVFGYYRAYVQNGTTAATVTVVSSFTAS